MFKDMTNEALVEAYWANRKMAFQQAEARNPRMNRTLKNIDIIVAIARKRGIRLV